ncbi:MAG: hypothetical protein HMLKMBBP_02628 [Planctomycetes bacterium]|nr:hypothetical protein [Planctomycetota bacterium]
MTDGGSCPVGNIAASGRRRRLAAGIAALVLAAVVVAAVEWTLDSRWGRAAAVPLLFFGWLCVFQAQGGT